MPMAPREPCRSDNPPIHCVDNARKSRPAEPEYQLSRAPGSGKPETDQRFQSNALPPARLSTRRLALKAIAVSQNSAVTRFTYLSRIKTVVPGLRARLG